MTGLDPERDTILSFACFVTDHKLNLLDQSGVEGVVHHSGDNLAQMNDWCVKTHEESGLSQACINSTTSPEEAAASLFTYVQRHVPESRRALLAGNSVHADKSFLVKPPWKQVIDHLHYRILDVSTLKEAARRWAPDNVLRNAPKKAGKHEAKADILESIEEARYYMQFFEKMQYGKTVENDSLAYGD